MAIEQGYEMKRPSLLRVEVHDIFQRHISLSSLNSTDTITMQTSATRSSGTRRRLIYPVAVIPSYPIPVFEITTPRKTDAREVVEATARIHFGET